MYQKFLAMAYSTYKHTEYRSVLNQWEDIDRFFQACRQGNLLYAQELYISQQSEEVRRTWVHFDDDAPFRWACANGHLEVAKWLIQNHPDIDHKTLNEWAFLKACSFGHSHVVKWLVEYWKEASITSKYPSGFRRAMRVAVSKMKEALKTPNELDKFVQKYWDMLTEAQKRVYYRIQIDTEHIRYSTSFEQVMKLAGWKDLNNSRDFVLKCWNSLPDTKKRVYYYKSQIGHEFVRHYPQIEEILKEPSFIWMPMETRNAWGKEEISDLLKPADMEATEVLAKCKNRKR